jgi:hypothetical protein
MSDFSCDYGVNPFKIFMTINSILPTLNFQYGSTNPDVATIDADGFVTVNSIGTTTLTFTYDATTSYLGSNISAILTVNPIATPFTFSIPPVVYTDDSFNIITAQICYLDTSLNLADPGITNVYGSSLGAIQYSIYSQTPLDETADYVATIDGSVITFNNPGSVQIQATQADNGNYIGNTILSEIIAVPKRGFFEAIPFSSYVFSDLSYALYNWTVYLDNTVRLNYSVLTDPSDITRIGTVNQTQFTLHFEPTTYKGPISVKAEILPGGSHSGNSVTQGLTILGKTTDTIEGVAQPEVLTRPEQACIQQ